MKKPKFKVGDRVAERPRPLGYFATRSSVQERIKPYRAQRYGTVREVLTRKLRSKTTQRIVVVKWDHLQSPSEHAQARLCFIYELEQMVKESRLAIGD